MKKLSEMTYAERKAYRAAKNAKSRAEAQWVRDNWEQVQAELREWYNKHREQQQEELREWYNKQTEEEDCWAEFDQRMKPVTE